ncbi:MAG: O-antigen ligase family protein [Planctomycetota bacterium]|jgi:O-antigen ligase
MADQKPESGYRSSYGYGDRDRVPLRYIASLFIPGIIVAIVMSCIGILVLKYWEFSFRNIGVVFALVLSYFLILIDIRIGLVLLYLSFGFSPEFEIGGIGNLRIEDFLIPVVLLAWVTKLIYRRPKLEPLNIRNPMIALILIMTFSSLINIGLYGLDYKRCILFFAKEIEYFVILLLVLNNVRTEKTIKIFIIVSLIVCIGSAMFCYMRFGNIPGGRFAGPAGEGANIIGSYYLIHILIAFGLLMKAKVGKHRFFLLVFLLMISFPFMATFSRSSFVALFMAIAITGLALERRFLILAIVLFLTLPIFVGPSIVERFLSVIKVFGPNPPSSWAARVFGWSVYWKIIQQAPFIGHGVGSAGLVVDNEYVKILSELGFVGLAVFFWFLIRIIITAFRTAKRADDGLFSGFAVGYFAMILGLVVHSIGATTFTTIRSMMPFYFLTGLLYVIYNNHIRPDDDEESPEPVKKSESAELSDSSAPVETADSAVQAVAGADGRVVIVDSLAAEKAK